MREEYIELKVSHGVPSRDAFTPVTPDTYQNRGDFSYAILQPAFMAKLAALQAKFQPRHGTWQINAIYRSAAHNRYHADSNIGGGVGSGVAPNSWHQYGCAADIQTFPAPRRSATDLKAATSYWNDLAAAARKAGFSIEPMVDSVGQYGSGVGHVHVSSCP